MMAVSRIMDELYSCSGDVLAHTVRLAVKETGYNFEVVERR